MITITHIRYTVKAEYAAQNRENIRRVMDNLRALHRPDLRYNVFVEDDGKTFIHLPLFASEDAKNVFEAQEAFQAFQAALRESVPEVPPKVTNLTLVGSSHDLFS
jgi:quinol monooxygenase YgiN